MTESVIKVRLFEVAPNLVDQKWAASPEAGHYAAFGPFETVEAATNFRDDVAAISMSVNPADEGGDTDDD